MASLSGIGSAAGYAGASTSGLQVELANLKREQSACINCASADTQEGKLNIQKLATEISSVQLKLEQTVPQSNATTTLSNNASAGRLDVYA
jgi:hypothetical protein